MGMIFKVPAILIYVVGGLWALLICLQIVAHNLGTIAAVIAFFLLPALISLAPWYQGLWHGDWFPVVLVYGGGILASILFAIGSAIDGR